MNILKTIVKVLCVPVMLTVKIIVALLGLLVMLVGYIISFGTFFVGSVIQVLASLCATLLTVVGIGVFCIYQGHYDQILANILGIAIMAVIALIPLIADYLLDEIENLGGTITMAAIFNIPIVINI